MKDICPNCEKITDLELIRRKEDIEVRGDHIEIEVEYFRCLDCGNEFEDPRSNNRPLESAYREYRKRHGMIQPEELRRFRREIGLTQNELSCLLGWGKTTLSRYENGALQDDTHDRALQMAMTPRTLLELLRKKQIPLGENKRERLIDELTSKVSKSTSLEKMIEENLGSYEPNVFNGYVEFDLEKLFNAIFYFCSHGAFRTTLNKLLFYFDFKHFKEHAVSITGLRYAHLPFGPSPDKYAIMLDLAIEDGMLQTEEVTFSKDMVREKVASKKRADLSVFSEMELETLVLVKRFFKGFTARRIHEFSSKEKGYRETADGQLISYDYASELQI